MMDLAKSVEEDFYGNNDEVAGVYEKLFFGNNLSVINRGNEDYIPQWDEEEYLIIKRVIREGLNLFCKFLNLECTNGNKI